jgi:hypothetical protein
MASGRFWWRAKGYSQLRHDSEEDGKEPIFTTQKRTLSWRSTATLIAAWVFTVITVYTFSFQVGRRSSSPTHKTISSSSISYNCGNTSAEARLKGCVFDIMNRGWFPPACYDAELTAEFDALGEALGGWKWYLNREGTEEISREEYEAGEGPQPLFVTQELHLWHCAYQWRKYHRAVERNTPIDSYMGFYNHTVHCSKILALHKEREGAAIEFYLTFPECPTWS